MVSKTCERCGKIFTVAANYTYHMNRKTPCIPREIANLGFKYKCNRCELTFHSNQNLTNHLNRKTPCLVKNPNPEELELRAIFELFQSEHVQLKTEHEELKEQLQNKNNHTKINNINSNNNITNIINVYGKEDMSHMTDAMYIRCFRQMQKSIETLFKMKHFSNKMESNQNMYITNLRDTYMMLYNGKNWNKVNRIKTLTDIYYTLKDDLLGIVETMREDKTIDAELDKHFKWFIEDELSDEMEERFVKASCETMACTAYNNRHFPIKIKSEMEKENKAELTRIIKSSKT